VVIAIVFDADESAFDVGTTEGLALRELTMSAIKDALELEPGEAKVTIIGLAASSVRVQYQISFATQDGLVRPSSGSGAVSPSALIGSTSAKLLADVAAASSLQTEGTVEIMSISAQNLPPSPPPPSSGGGGSGGGGGGGSGMSSGPAIVSTSTGGMNAIALGAGVGGAIAVLAVGTGLVVLLHCRRHSRASAATKDANPWAKSGWRDCEPCLQATWSQRLRAPAAASQERTHLQTSADCTACLCCSPTGWTLHDTTTFTSSVITHTSFHPHGPPRIVGAGRGRGETAARTLTAGC
jgi:hypothetical protein